MPRVPLKFFFSLHQILYSRNIIVLSFFFIVLSFIIEAAIHLGLLSVYDMMWGHFFVFLCAFPIESATFIERLYISTLQYQSCHRSEIMGETVEFVFHVSV